MKDKLIQGETLFADGKIEEAEKCFLNVLKYDPQNKEVLNNLGVIAFQGQQIESAIDYFDKSLKIDPFYKEAVLNYVYILKELNLIAEASSYLYKIIEANPNDKELKQLLNEIEIVQKPKIKLAVLCLPGLESFLGDILDFFQTKYEVRTCYSTNNQEIESAIKWAGVVWLEWANEMAVALTNHPTLLNGKRVICRLHSYEAFAGYVGKIKLEKISDLIFVAEHIKDIVLKQVRHLSDKIKSVHIVPNGVNLKKFPFKERRPGYNLAYVGHINYKKGPMLLLHAFRELVQKESRYRLFVAGNFQDTRYELYFNQMIKEMGLEKNIQMDGWVEDVADWLEDKQYIVCTSVLESQNMSIMEAMARGLKPVIHNFVGAKGIYPKKYIWNTIPQFVKKVTEPDYDSKEYHNVIKKNYSFDCQVSQLTQIITNQTKMETNTDYPPAHPSCTDKEILSRLPLCKVEDSIKNQLVSVIIPAYNSENYIKKAIESVIEQTYSCWELIIIDDGSRDQTKDVVKPYLSDNRIHYFYKENGGEATARNAGLEKANGVFISWLDADDYLESTYLAKAVKWLMQDESILFVYPNLCLIDTSGNHLASWRYKSYEIPMLISELFKTGHSVVPGVASTTARKELYDKLGTFDVSFKMAPDYEFLSRIGHLKGKIRCLEEELYYYVQRNDSQVRNIEQKFEFCAQAMERMINRYSFEALFPELTSQKIEPNSLYLNTLFHIEKVFNHHIYDKLSTGLIDPFLKRKDKYSNLIQVRWRELSSKRNKLHERLENKQVSKNMTMSLPLIREKIKNLKQRWDKRGSLEDEKVLFHLSPQGANRFIMLQYAAVFKYLDAKVEFLHFKERGHQKEIFNEFHPTIFFSATADIFINNLDLELINDYKAREGLTRIVWAEQFAITDGLHHMTPKKAELIVSGKIGDLFITATDESALIESYSEWKNEMGINVKSLPFASNPLIHYELDFNPLFDIGFIGSNSPSKFESIRAYLYPLLRKYPGIILGDRWGGQDLVVPPEKNNSFYASVIIAPNIHQPFQRETGADCNDRTFVIPACGGFQIVDNVSCVKKYFNPDEIVIAEDLQEWFDLFEYFLNAPEERQQYIQKGKNRVLKDHTYFDRLFRLADYLDNV